MIKEIIVINNNYSAIPDDLDKFTFLTIYFPLNCCKKKRKLKDIFIITTLFYGLPIIKTLKTGSFIEAIIRARLYL